VVRGLAPRQEAERHRRDLARSSEWVLAVAMLEMESAPNDQHAPGIVFFDGAAQRVFEGCRAARWLAEAPLRLYPPDDGPEVRCGKIGRRATG